MQIRLLALKDELLEIEMDTVESLAELIGEFDRNYSEICDGNKAHFSSFFGQVRAASVPGGKVLGSCDEPYMQITHES